MYTVSNRPSTIVAKTRRSIIQNVERLENLRDSKKTQNGEETCESVSVPKPFFQPVNGKRSHSYRNNQEAITPQQEEVIKFIYDSWTSICKEGEEETMETKMAQNQSKVVYYECQPNNELKDFTPFDLESWWGKRLFNTITKSIP